MLTVKYTAKMKHDVKRLKKRRYDINKLTATINLIQTQAPMPPEYRDHQLKGKLSDFRECHVGGEGDWLLMYQVFEDELILSASATGTHQDLFEDY
jgi:mRNA interferase YafQ